MFEYLVNIVQENAALMLIVGLALWRHDARDIEQMQKLDRRLLKIETKLGVEEND